MLWESEWMGPLLSPCHQESLICEGSNSQLRAVALPEADEV